ncbi:hypothetical protein ACIQUM_43030 [Amycolatopsis azurea]|uniref:hypothetical protein n=1 Tax=Amycolatopsis azurea TaxID=36819 RepID=UPI0038268F7D
MVLIQVFAQRMIAVAAAILVAATGVQTAQAAPAQGAAECYWRQTRLPMPQGIDYAYVEGSAGTEWIVASGSNYPEPAYGIIWHDQQPRIMLRFRDGSRNETQDINRNGVVVGAKVDASYKPTPYVYQTFYRWLPKPATGNTYATALNDREDITGYVWTDGAYRIVFWQAGGTGYRILGNGFPVGIDETGRVVASTGEIYHADGSQGRLQAPAGLSGIVASQFDEGVVAGYGTDSAGERVAVVWDAAGKVLSTISGATAKAANPRGVVLGFPGASSGSSVNVWRDGVREATLSGPRPNFSDTPQPSGPDVSLTADDTIIATPMGLPEPSYWRCVPN